MVSSSAMASARLRRLSAALRITLERSKADTFRQVRKPLSAASRARSRSARSAWATVPILSPVAGLTTSMVRPDAALVQAPSMKSETSVYMFPVLREVLRRWHPAPGHSTGALPPYPLAHDAAASFLAPGTALAKPRSLEGSRSCDGSATVVEMRRPLGHVLIWLHGGDFHVSCDTAS